MKATVERDSYLDEILKVKGKLADQMDESFTQNSAYHKLKLKYEKQKEEIMRLKEELVELGSLDDLLSPSEK